MNPTLVWFRRDLRLGGHPALSAVLAAGGAVVAVHVHGPDEEGAGAPGAAGRWWLHHSLTRLDGLTGTALTNRPWPRAMPPSPASWRVPAWKQSFMTGICWRNPARC
ncbi:MAG: deoxyribodipyrimidine photo-lyase [Gammaproteobacteria bacterium]|nr:deoxyribodipyrimidine photo-lyase [Gammaproteobacteria bacterium]